MGSGGGCSRITITTCTGFCPRGRGGETARHLSGAGLLPSVTWHCNMSLAVETSRIFVIDDNHFMREAIAAMLREIGFRDVFQAQDGDDALRQLEEANPALIICDINMKPMDGFQFVEALRAHASPNAPNVPVIFLTSHTEPSIVKRALTLAVYASVVTPVDKNRLEPRALPR